MPSSILALVVGLLLPAPRHLGQRHARQAVVRHPPPHLQIDMPEDMPEMPSIESALARPDNLYFEQMSNISAPDLIKRFAETAPPEVQKAFRATIASLMGNLPPQVGEVSIMSTGMNVASLMYSMQMTGYMFRNAEYRRTLVQSLGSGESKALPPVEVSGGTLPEVSGTIKVKLGEAIETEVEAAAYMAELRAEVSSLRTQIVKAREAQDEPGGQLLSYLQSLPRETIPTLTSGISEDVLEAMTMLIERILADAGVQGEQFMETSGLKLRELLVWQLISGYTLREIEAKEELKKMITAPPAEENN